MALIFTLDERVPYRDSLAKYAAAFFKRGRFGELSEPVAAGISDLELAWGEGKARSRQGDSGLATVN